MPPFVLWSFILVLTIALVILRNRWQQNSRELKKTIEERGQTIQSLQSSEHTLNLVTQNINEAVVAIDENFRIEFYNGAFKEIFTDGSVRIHNKSFQDIVRNVALNELIDRVLRTKHSEKQIMDIEQESKKITVEVNAIHVPAIQGTLILVVFYDLTEIKEAERMKREFITNASHQLKTPLTAIQGYAETLLEDIAVDVNIRQDFLAKIRNKSIEASDLVSKLLKLSKLESRAVDFNITTINVGREVAKKFEAVLKRQHIEIVHEGDEVTIQSDLTLFQLIIENLLENAVKYSKPEAKIFIQIEREDENVKIIIQDQGIGIPEQDLPRIFERFFRSQNAENHSHDGVGIGMAMVKSALDRLDGKIEISSDQGHGTTISLSFPVNIDSGAKDIK
jgi:two-component system phosphate regulon sensor histidine kinase PhoR